MERAEQKVDDALENIMRACGMLTKRRWGARERRKQGTKLKHHTDNHGIDGTRGELLQYITREDETVNEAMNQGLMPDDFADGLAWSPMPSVEAIDDAIQQR